MPDIFEKRTNYKPFEYDSITTPFIHAMWASHWSHNEFNFSSDVQDYLTELTKEEREVVKKSALLISQLEVSIKAYWGNIGNLLPKPEIADMGAVFGGVECHKEGTEILTPRGWVNFKDLSKEEKVYQFNINDSTITSTNIKRYIKKPFKGELIVYKDRSYDARVTPGHRFIYKDIKENIIEKEAENFHMYSKYKLPHTAELKGGKVNSLSYEDRIKIAVQADGTRLYWTNKEGNKKWRGDKGGYNYSIRVKKGRKKDRLRYLLKSSNLDWVENDYDREGYKEFKIKFKDTINYKDFNWVNLIDKTSSWCKEFVEELLKWDGSLFGNNRKVYNSTNKSCVDIVEVIAILSGYKTHITTKIDNRKDSYKKMYSISFKDNPKFSSKTLKHTKEHYEGYVYCVEVPTGMIITRYNDRVCISGNCIHSRAYSKILDVLNLNEEFEELLEQPTVKNRVKYLNKYVEKEYKNNKKNILYSLILFTLFTEATSLFSQFYVLLGFSRFRGILKDISNIVQYTSKEEEIHKQGGVALINKIVEENPELMDDKMEEKIYEETKVALDSESDLIDWMLDGYENEFLSEDILKKYVKYRLNECLGQINIKKPFKLRQEDVDKFLWMEEEILAPASTDFFNKKPIDYSKASRSFSEDELFD